MIFVVHFFIDRKREYEYLNMGVHMLQRVYGGQRTMWESEFSCLILCAPGIDIVTGPLLSRPASLSVHVLVWLGKYLLGFRFLFSFPLLLRQDFI